MRVSVNLEVDSPANIDNGGGVNASEGRRDAAARGRSWSGFEKAIMLCGDYKRLDTRSREKNAVG
jgi:hypothetical protein